MKAHRFKLQSVLQLRELAEKEAQQSHAAAGRRLAALLSELHEAVTECKQLAEQLEGVQRSSFRPAQRENLWNALKYKQDHCVQLRPKAEVAVKELEEKREELLGARRDHEAMARLMKKQRQDHARMTEKEEWAMIDDMVTARHAAARRPRCAGASV